MAWPNFTDVIMMDDSPRGIRESKSTLDALGGGLSIGAQRTLVAILTAHGSETTLSLMANHPQIGLIAVRILEETYPEISRDLATSFLMSEDPGVRTATGTANSVTSARVSSTSWPSAFRATR